jgi:hypothetical protein
MTLQIGDSVWIKDENNRVYVDDNGVKHLSPILRKKFVEWFIVGETRISWEISKSPKSTWVKPVKVKKALVNKTFFTSEEEVEKTCWVETNRFRISRMVGDSKDFDKLKEIEKILSEGN